MTHTLKQTQAPAMASTLLMTKPTRIVNFATVFPMVKTRPEAAVALVRTQAAEVRLARAGRSNNASCAFPLKAAPARKHARLANLEADTLTVPRISGVMSRAAGTAELEPLGTAELNLPFGMPFGALSMWPRLRACSRPNGPTCCSNAMATAGTSARIR